MVDLKIEVKKYKLDAIHLIATPKHYSLVIF